jgi:hypothetical protein
MTVEDFPKLTEFWKRLSYSKQVNFTNKTYSVILTYKQGRVRQNAGSLYDKKMAR